VERALKPGTKADSPYRTVADLIEGARKNPRKLSDGTVGTGSVGHFNGEVLSRSNGIKLKHVPFMGTGEVVPAITGGHVDIALGAPSSVLPLVQAEKLKVLTLSGSVKLSAHPLRTGQARRDGAAFRSNREDLLRGLVETLTRP
jgi:tripartite-type tricarboxylate transporter receptor subunit TctC